VLDFAHPLIYAFTAGPLPKFDGINIDVDQRPQSAASPPPTGAAGAVRVPSLNPDDIAKFSSLFLQSETQGGVMPGIPYRPLQLV
jgi:epidermal growth factor receptor substrate 15